MVKQASGWAERWEPASQKPDKTTKRIERGASVVSLSLGLPVWFIETHTSMTSLQEGNKKIEFSSWADGLSSPNCLATWVISSYCILLRLVDRPWSHVLIPSGWWAHQDLRSLVTCEVIGFTWAGATHLCNKDGEQQHPPVSLKLLSYLERPHRALEWTWDGHLHRLDSNGASYDFTHSHRDSSAQASTNRSCVWTGRFPLERSKIKMESLVTNPKNKSPPNSWEVSTLVVFP